METIMLYMNLILTLIISLANFMYFLIVKNNWRWTKLALAINSTIIFFMLLEKRFFSLGTGVHYVEITLLVITLLGITVSAYSKLIAEGYNIEEEFKKLILGR